MTFDEACGIRNPHGITHNEKYRRYLEYIGMEPVQAHLPEPVDALAKAWCQDRDLNNIPLSKWEKAAGYPGDKPRQGGLPPTASGPFPRLLMSRGVTVFSSSECVCLLKHAAEQAVVAYLRAGISLEGLSCWGVFQRCRRKPDPMNRHNIFDFDCVALFPTEQQAADFEAEDPERRIRKPVRGAAAYAAAAGKEADEA